MYKKLFTIIVLTTSLCYQSAWCMEDKKDTKKTIVTSKEYENFRGTFTELIISGDVEDHSVNLKDYITDKVKQITLNTTYPCSIKGTTFDGIENAAKHLHIDIKWADDIDFENLDKAMRVYAEKHRLYPTVVLTKNPKLRSIMRFPFFAAVYKPKAK